MRKNIRTVLFAVLSLLTLTMLSGCLEDTTPLAQRSGGLIDMGTMPVPGKAYQVHGYRLDNGFSHDHFLYVIENTGGQMLSGVMANEVVSAGKASTRVEAVQTEVPHIVAPAPASSQTGLTLNLKLSCDSVEQCQRKLDVLRDTQ